MTSPREIGVRFPGRELEVHRLYARSGQFREVCNDYVDAQKAYHHWQLVVANPERAREYHDLTDELEAEILALLDAAQTSYPSTDGIGAN